MLQMQDRDPAQFPEVERVFGKAGRAETSTDPAPFSMMETTVMLKPESEWRRDAALVLGVGAGLAEAGALRRDHAAITSRIESWSTRWTRRCAFPASPTPGRMPIKARIDMLSTGVRTPVGIKILGADLPRSSARRRDRGACCRGAGHAQRLRRAHRRRLLRRLRLRSATRSRATGSRSRTPRRSSCRPSAARTSPPRSRGASATRSTCATPATSASDLERCARAGADAGWRAGAAGADRRHPLVEGPAMIRNENGLLAGYVYVDMAGRDVGGYVEEAKRRWPRERVTLPPGYSPRLERPVREHAARPRAAARSSCRSRCLLIVVLLYLNTKSVGRRRRIVLLAVPFSAVGAVWLLYLLDYNMSIARLGRHDRADGPRRRDRRLHAALPRPGLRRARARGPTAQSQATWRRRSCTAP